MDKSTLDQIANDAKVQVHIVTSSVAYAVNALEMDSNPKFRLDTVVLMGLSDEEVNDPESIARMRWEYRAWVVGHGLADISESIATFLNKIVKLDGKAIGCTERFKKFERLGLDLKIKSLPNLNLDADYQEAVETITRARNCLIHRHGVIGERDCNATDELILRWRGIKLFKILPDGLAEILPSHRGPATEKQGDKVQLQVTGIERRFKLGERLDLEPLDLCTLSWCIQGIMEALHFSVANLVVPKP